MSLQFNNSVIVFFFSESSPGFLNFTEISLDFLLLLVCLFFSFPLYIEEDDQSGLEWVFSSPGSLRLW